MSSIPQDSIKWLPKSPKLYSGHNWSSQGSRWASLKGKEGFHGGNLYKLSSANGKWREGRISPEQEAEELEDPDDVSNLEIWRDSVYLWRGYCCPHCCAAEHFGFGGPALHFMSLLVQRVHSCVQCYIPSLCLQLIHPTLKSTVQPAD